MSDPQPVEAEPTRRPRQALRFTDGTTSDPTVNPGCSTYISHSQTIPSAGGFIHRGPGDA